MAVFSCLRVNPASVRRFKRAIRASFEGFLRFTHRYWFHDIAEQAQTRALFRMTTAHLGYIVRDHDAAKFAARKAQMQHIAACLNDRYGAGTVELDIKDSTLRFHNKNIYDKLGVSSLKQLQQFVAILNSGSGSAPDESGPKKAR